MENLFVLMKEYKGLEEINPKSKLGFKTLKELEDFVNYQNEGDIRYKYLLPSTFYITKIELFD